LFDLADVIDKYGDNLGLKYDLTKPLWSAILAVFEIIKAAELRALDEYNSVGDGENDAKEIAHDRGRSKWHEVVDGRLVFPDAGSRTFTAEMGGIWESEKILRYLMDLKNDSWYLANAIRYLGLKNRKLQ
jgi:hypothetical protein